MIFALGNRRKSLCGKDLQRRRGQPRQAPKSFVAKGLRQIFYKEHQTLRRSPLQWGLRVCRTIPLDQRIDRMGLIRVATNLLNRDYSTHFPSQNRAVPATYEHQPQNP